MKLSIIVCTRNRAYAITACLDSLAEALSHAALIDAEIVVVDNGSTDDTSAVVTEWASRCAFPVRLLYEPRKGLSVARNRGIREAAGELLALTDDDCRLSVAYVRDALRHDAGDSGPTLRGGRVELGDPTDLPLTIQTNPERQRWQRQSISSSRQHLGGGVIPGCNMLLRRTVVERLGLFDERLGAGANVPAGEDTDYVLRAYLANIPVEYVPDMAVSHFHGRKEAAEARNLMRNYLLGTGALYAKFNFRHPNLRRKIRILLRNIFSPSPTAQSVAPPGNEALSVIDFPTKTKLAYIAKGAFDYVSSFRRSP